MKKSYHQILSYVYENEEVGIREISKMMERKYNDHRDFYGLAALLKEGYIGFTGPIHDEQFYQVQVFQCYSQGDGNQTYRSTSIYCHNKDSYFYIGAKGIAYFHQRWEVRRGWYMVAVLTLIASILSGVIVSSLTNSVVNCVESSQMDNS